MSTPRNPEAHEELRPVDPATKPDPARWSSYALNGDSFGVGFSLAPPMTTPQPAPPRMTGLIMIP